MNISCGIQSVSTKSPSDFNRPGATGKTEATMATTPPPAPTNALTVKLNTFKALLNASKDAIQSRLPRHVTAERILKVALTSINKNPKLLECTRDSVMLSIMQAAELGLEPGGALGEGYLIPYNNKVKGQNGKPDRWEMQCQFMPGYRGLISLSRRSGQIISIESHVVHAKDKFSCALGLDPSLVHEPAWEEANPGPLRFVYAVAKLKDGGTQFEVMSKSQIDAIRARSKSSDSGPWVTDYNEMARKTVIRRLFKYLPVSVELAQAFEHDAAASGEGPEFAMLDGGTIDLQLTDGGDEPEGPTAESLMDKLGITEQDRVQIRASYADRPAELMEYLIKKTEALEPPKGTVVAKESTPAAQQTETGKRGGSRAKKPDAAPDPQPETKQSEPETKADEHETVIEQKAEETPAPKPSNTAAPGPGSFNF
jgi:recombination protein RecT